MKTAQLVDGVTQTLIQESNSNHAELTRSYNYRKKLVNNLRNGSHQIAAIPLSYFEFDYTNDKKLAAFIFDNLTNDVSVLEDVSIKRKGGERFLIIEAEINLLSIENDSLKIFGSSNILLKAAELSKNAWQIANSTNATIEMNYDIVLLMGQISNLIESYSQTSEKAIDILYSREDNILPVLEDMKAIELELLTKHESLNELLN